MRQYIECRNAKYDKIRIKFFRVRHERTIYMASATPCKIGSCCGMPYEDYNPVLGYRAELGSASRASKKALGLARVELKRFIEMVLERLAKHSQTHEL